MFGTWWTQRRARANYAAGLRALDTDDRDLALCFFNEAVRTDPRFAPGYLGCGLANLRKGEFAVAIADLSEAIRLSGDARGYYLRSLGYQGTGDRERERADYCEAVHRDRHVAQSLCDPAA